MLEKIFYGTGFDRDRMSAARAAYLLLIWVLLPTWLFMQFLNLLVGLALTGSFSMLSQRIGADIGFRRPQMSWKGDIGFEDLAVRPLDASQKSLSLTVRRVHFDMPNWGVMQSVLAAAGSDDEASAEQVGMMKVIDRMDHIGVRIEGMKFDALDGLPGALGYVGMASAAPMEAEGCVGDTLWVASELPKLGIVNDGIDLQLTLANVPEAREVHVTGQLVSPKSSRAEFAQHFKATSLSNFLEAPPGGRIATYERLAVEDDGFIAARDAYCAKRDGVDHDTFRQRHLAAVRRLLEARGMRAPAAVESVYLQYLQKGKLVLEANPSGTMPRENYRHYAVADQMAMYRGKLSGSGNPVPLQLEAVPARAIAENYPGSTWDLVAAESAARAGGAGDEVAIAVAAPAPLPTPAAPVAVPAPAAIAAAPVPARAPVAPVAKAPLAVAASMAGTTTRTTVDGRPLASSLPATGAPKRTGATTLRFEELAQHVGELLEITTIHGARRQGHIDSVRGSTLRLRVSAGLGFAIVNVERAQIRLIRDLD